jgi:ketosteroid isomerase-like protein
MRQLTSGVAAALLAACAGHAPAAVSPDAASPAAGRAAVMQADIDYAAATAARRLDGWMSFLAPDMVKAPWKGDFVHGLTEIRRLDADIFADTTTTLEWKPTDGGVYSDGRYGYTKGRYEMVKRSGAERTVLGRGTYLTVWRRDPAGWRVVLDTGVPDSRQ